MAVISVIASSVAGWSRNSRYFLLSLTGADAAFGLVVMPLNLCKQRLKLQKHNMGGRNRPDVASRVLIPVMTVYYTCWTPCMVTILYNAISGSRVPEWVEFVAVWLPTANGFLNCIFYFWINRSFRRKFRLVVLRLCLALCPAISRRLGCSGPIAVHVVGGVWDNNNSIQERSSSVSSTCTLLTLAAETNIVSFASQREWSMIRRVDAGQWCSGDGLRQYRCIVGLVQNGNSETGWGQLGARAGQGFNVYNPAAYYK
ncbi:hypothetical protein SKAU_G00347610 [Synaphobranchus kaupii]|uniref:G-protein coupled receptors family 1 profile domain-containing protein n=1 Tax=Synaphobranchus kaupii TaxID=118154 RepID=A0A9Q1EJY7_SYNKA|nr:hypothetical protein SKAU_G00347610 [Synaphobranchus kaupii]